MAFDKNQLMIHQMQVKSQRLESGLERLVKALTDMPEQIPESVKSAYSYALGCLGGDYLKRQLFATDDFVAVAQELKAKKFMKADTADKNIALWNEKHEKDALENKSEAVVADEAVSTAPSSATEEPAAKKSIIESIGESIGDLFSTTEPEKEEEPKMAEITIVPVHEDPKKDVPPPPPPAPVPSPAPMKKGPLFGSFDREGNIIPRDNRVTCDYAAPAPSENKFGGVSSGGSDSSSSRRVIACY